MIKRLLFCLLVLLCANFAEAQYSRYVIKFKDKKNTPYTLKKPDAFLSAKAIVRRILYKINFDSTDLPITPAYIDSVQKITNVVIINKSKWFNQVLIQTTDAAALAKINSFAFVKAAQPLAARVVPGTPINKFAEEKIITAVTTNSRIAANQLNYGASAEQITIHKGEYLHNKGFTGKGISIAMLDGGYQQYKTNPALDSVRLQNRILGEYDFVANEQSVNEDDAHGAFCFSIIAANTPDVIVGSAPHANFWLLRTEDVYSEYPVEEQNWAAAAEFADSAGVDMISTSLGYSDFDDASFDHTYAQRDGNTTLVTRAADLAAKKGILVCVSAGNYGNKASDLKFVSCPADADSVLTVGATNVSGAIASFSSWGPNGAGKTKPNVVSVGAGTTFAYFDGRALKGNGTSFSNPNMAGLAACLWQAYPEFNNMEIIDALQKSASKYLSLDDRFGFGIPDMQVAFELLATEKAKREKERILAEQQRILGEGRIKIFPTPANAATNALIKPSVTGKATLQLFDVKGNFLWQQNISITSNEVQVVALKIFAQLPKGVYYFKYAEDKFKQTISVVK
jgi:serine protease AprX